MQVKKLVSLREVRPTVGTKLDGGRSYTVDLSAGDYGGIS